MRILYIDVDTLRPDHLGCYGYPRPTSPAIDSVARAGVRFDQVYCSDAPCLPSRTALFCGRYGIHTGVVDHAGIAADFFPEGPARGFRSTLGETNWMQCLRKQGLRTVTISPFGDRHCAWWFYAGFLEIINSGKYGGEIATDVEPLVLDWLNRNGAADHWFLHVNLWDPHNPYRTPDTYGHPFQDKLPPLWLTEQIRRRHWQGAGPESAQDAAEFQEVARTGYPHSWESFPRQPVQMSSMRQVRRLFDGYDVGIRYADDAVGRILATLQKQGVYDETAVIISSDHGENLGELNIYGAHMTADEATCRVPLIIRWPGVTDALAGGVFQALHCHLDLAATVVQFVGGDVPPWWDSVGFGNSLRQGRNTGRDYLVLSNLAGVCQRTVRFDHYLAIRSYHDGYHGFPDWMLFDVRADPHLQQDLAPRRAELVDRAARLLDQWLGDVLRSATHAQDPLWTVLHAGGPEHTRGYLPAYLQRLRATGRRQWAEKLERIHLREAAQISPQRAKSERGMFTVMRCGFLLTPSEPLMNRGLGGLHHDGGVACRNYSAFRLSGAWSWRLQSSALSSDKFPVGERAPDSPPNSQHWPSGRWRRFAHGDPVNSGGRATRTLSGDKTLGEPDAQIPSHRSPWRRDIQSDCGPSPRRPIQRPGRYAGGTSQRGYKHQRQF
jgi:arylsulfatase A-like enzyme